MAGSYHHCLTEDGNNYRGHDMLENMGDMKEGVEEMMFIILYAKHSLWGGEKLISQAHDYYFRCLRGERPWPDFMKPGIDK